MGRHLLIFPQGTRLSPDDYQPYHNGLYALYSATELPVVPVALNSGYFWSKDSISNTGPYYGAVNAVNPGWIDKTGIDDKSRGSN